MSKINWEGSTLLAPVPVVLISCGTLERHNAFTVAWCGIINSQPAKTYISVRPERYSHGIIKASGEFVINLTSSDLVRAVDFCGVKSGKELDKLAACNLTVEPSQKIAAPRIVQCPMALECKVTDVVHMGSHDMFIADIVAVGVEDYLLGEDGKLHMQRAKLLAYAHGAYYKLGERLGAMGFSVRKRPVTTAVAPKKGTAPEKANPKKGARN